MPDTTVTPVTTTTRTHSTTHSLVIHGIRNWCGFGRCRGEGGVPDVNISHPTPWNNMGSIESHLSLYSLCYNGLSPILYTKWLPDARAQESILTACIIS